eukprot:Sspe_Gene.51711::Locus_28683_Transcript_1_1_Confidence_1.000_Length_2220::g.51711::m.51711
MEGWAVALLVVLLVVPIGGVGFWIFRRYQSNKKKTQADPEKAEDEEAPSRQDPGHADPDAPAGPARQIPQMTVTSPSPVSDPSESGSSQSGFVAVARRMMKKLGKKEPPPPPPQPSQPVAGHDLGSSAETLKGTRGSKRPPQPPAVSEIAVKSVSPPSPLAQSASTVDSSGCVGISRGGSALGLPATGSKVMAHGLQHRGELNGQQGTVLGYSKDESPFVFVKFPNSTLKMSPQNIRSMESRRARHSPPPQPVPVTRPRGAPIADSTNDRMDSAGSPKVFHSEVLEMEIAMLSSPEGAGRSEGVGHTAIEEEGRETPLNNQGAMVRGNAEAESGTPKEEERRSQQGTGEVQLEGQQGGEGHDGGECGIEGTELLDDGGSEPQGRGEGQLRQQPQQQQPQEQQPQQLQPQQQQQRDNLHVDGGELEAGGRGGHGVHGAGIAEQQQQDPSNNQPEQPLHEGTVPVVEVGAAESVQNQNEERGPDEHSTPFHSPRGSTQDQGSPTYSDEDIGPSASQAAERSTPHSQPPTNPLMLMPNRPSAMPSPWGLAVRELEADDGDSWLARGTEMRSGSASTVHTKPGPAHGEPFSTPQFRSREAFMEPLLSVILREGSRDPSLPPVPRDYAPVPLPHPASPTFRRSPVRVRAEQPTPRVLLQPSILENPSFG